MPPAWKRQRMDSFYWHQPGGIGKLVEKVERRQDSASWAQLAFAWRRESENDAMESDSRVRFV